MLDDIDRTVLDTHHALNAKADELDAAKERRMLAFALANEKGKTSGDLARLTGVTPMQALHMIREGRRILNRRRDQQERRAA